MIDYNQKISGRKMNMNGVSMTGVQGAIKRNLNYPQHKQLRVCAYARVSTDNDDQANSYESQVSYFTEYIQQNSEWKFVGIYADEGISGTSTKKRDNFNRMISDAENGLIDLILTKEVSRFARNTVDTLSYTRKLKKHGVYVIFVNDNINTRDNDGELRLSIMATIAQDESRKTSERVKWGQKRRMEQGVVFGRDMLGYAVRDGKLELIEEEAKIVRLIFHKYLDEGKGCFVIARELREAGIKSKFKNDWSNTIILRVLRNEKYVGDLLQKKTFTPDYLSHEKKYNRGNEDMVYIRDHHPEIAIIDRDTWDKTQAELERRSPSEEQKAKHSNRYWCSGKLVCGECGQRFVSRTKKLKNGTTYKAWRCYASAMHGNPKTDDFGNKLGCTGTSIGDRTLRYLTAYAINSVNINKASIKQGLLVAIKEIVGLQQRPINKSKVMRDIEEIRKKKLRIIDLAASNLISDADLKEQNEAYNNEIYELNQKLVEAENADTMQNQRTKVIQQYIERIDALIDFTEDNQEALAEILDKAVIFNGNIIDIYLKCVPFGIRLKYETSGKMEYFKVVVLSAETVDSDVQY